MKKDLIFLTSEGQGSLTSSSANHIANMAKEYISNLEMEIKNISFVQTTAGLISSSEKSIISEGWHKDQLVKTSTILNKIAELKSLIAWLREGIKAKESIYQEAKYLRLNDWAKMNNIQVPEFPEENPVITEDEVISQWTVKERNTYYMLETLCAVYGKTIHEDGAYNKAKKNLQDKLSNPHEIAGSGRDTIIRSYHPTVELQDVEDNFFQLQSFYRDNQARLNGMKHIVEEAIKQDEIQKQADYNRRYEEYATLHNQLSNQFSLWQKQELERISKLKIIIPNDLQEIYTFINNLGK